MKWTIIRLKRISILLIFISMLMPAIGQTATDNIDFKPRLLKTGDPTGGSGIYTIKGDLNIVGNSNLTAAPYWSENVADVENTYPMIYTDIDDNPATVNSSKATLNFADENEANHDCTNIIFAGLYWGGIGDNSDKGTTGPDSWQVTPRKYLRHGDTYNGWTLSISIMTRSNDVVNVNETKYTFSKTGQTPVSISVWGGTRTPTLETTTSWTINTGVTCRPIPNSSPTRIVSITDIGKDITVGSGAEAFKIKQLTYTSGTNTISTDAYRAMSLVTIEAGTEVTLDKKKVKFKHANDNSYQDITADKNGDNYAIFYKTGISGRDNIYSAFADVTDYVKEYGMGEYCVADIATTDGCSNYLYYSGGQTSLRGNNSGKSAGWGLIVIYENNQMNWRNISVFDGYSYIENTGGGTVIKEYPITIEGIQTIQRGTVNMKLGGIAFEGDGNLGGDYLQIGKEDGTWLNLSHEGNTANNFFNSSVHTGGNPRTPDNTNNFGTDIYIFNVPNEDNSIIKNNQTTLKFKAGTNSDNYTINAFTFAVDAYVPEIDPYNYVNKIDGIEVNTQENLVVTPGKEIEYVLDVRNVGNEPFTKAYIDIPIPYNATYVDASAIYYPGITGTISFDKSTNDLRWEFTSDLPTLPDMPVLATLTYKIKATDDCFILDGHCLNGITIQGYLSGEGAISGETFDKVELVHEYEQVGDCFYRPITDPTVIEVDASGFDCSSVTGFRTFVYPEELGNLSGIPLDEIRTYFPSDVRFYDKIDESSGDPTPDATEYTDANPFPKQIGLNYYYATYTVLDIKCWQRFSIHVFGVDGNVCEGNELAVIFKNTLAGVEGTLDVSRFDYFIYDQDNEASDKRQVGADYLFQAADNNKYVKYKKCDGCSDTDIDIQSTFILLNVNPAPVITESKTVLYLNEEFDFRGTPAGGTWSSSASDIIQINSAGHAQASQKGEAVLTYEADGCTKDIIVTVTNENKWIGQNRGPDPQTGGLTGIENNYWSIPSNWTDGRLPLEGERVIFHDDAIPLYVNSYGNIQGNIYTVAGVDNATAADLVILPDCGLKITNDTPALPAINFTNSASVVINSEDPATPGSANGTFIVPQNAKVNAVINFYTKAKGPADATEVADMSWQYFGIPVKSFWAGDLNGAFVRQYDETKTITEEQDEENTLIYYWHWLTNESIMRPVTGYEISRRETHSGNFTFYGELNTADIDTVLSITADSYFKGQHVVSNPYTAALDIKTGLEFGLKDDDTFNKTVYLFHTGTPGEWETHIGADDEVLPGQYLTIPQENAGSGNLPLTIPSMQGFVVELNPAATATEGNAAARTLKFKYSGASDTNLPMRTSPSGNEKPSTMISLYDNNEKLIDRAWIFINEKSTRNFDNGYDGRKKIVSPGLAQLFSYENDGIYQVNTTPDINNTSLGFKGQEGITNYTLAFAHNNIESIYQNLYLIDLETNILTEITADKSSYTFAGHNTHTATNRFVLRAHEKEISNQIKNKVDIYQENDRVFFINLYDEEVLVNIYDIAGRLTQKLKLPPLYSTSLPEGNFVSGVYVIKIYGENIRESSDKIIIK